MKQLKLLFTVLFLAVLGLGNVWGESTTITFSDVASANSWTNGTAYTDVTLEGFKFEVSGGGNNGKYYTSDFTWRFYSGGGLTITPIGGKKITAVSSDATSTFTIAEDGSNASISFSGTVKYKSITVTYTVGSSADPFTVTLMDNSTELTEASAGAGVTLPERTTTCTNYEFMGWSETNCATETTTAPTIIEAGDYKPSKNVELYPVFKKTEGDDTPLTASVNIVDYATANSWQGSGAKAYTSFGIDEKITISTTGTTNNGKYYTDWRLYQVGNGNAIVTAADGYSLTSVKFTFSVSNTGQLSYNSSAVTSGTAVNVSGSSATFTVGNSSSATNGQVKITVIEVKYAAESQNYYIAVPTCDAEPELISIGVTGTPAEFWKGDEFNYDGITVTALWDDETETDVTSKCTFTGYDMSVAGNQSVTVTYKGETTTYPIEIKTIANTQETAYTVAEAKSLIDAGKDLVTEVYVKGTISKIVTAYSSDYGNISFNVSADGATTGQQFQFYRNFKGTDKAKWEDSDTKPAVGDDVVGYGTMKLHSGTYEFAEGNYVVAITRAMNPTIDPVSFAVDQNVVPVIENAPANYTVTYVSEDDDIVLADGDEMLAMSVGKVNITATIKADGYKDATVTFEVTVTTNATLQSVTIGGELENATYTYGDAFNKSGLTATAHYSDGNTADVTETATWTFNGESNLTLTASGNVNVVATFNEVASTAKVCPVTVNKKVSDITIADMEIGVADANVAIEATTTPAEAELTFTIVSGGEYITLADGKVSGKAEGTAVVKASFAGNDEYAESEKNFNVKVSNVLIAKKLSFVSGDNSGSHNFTDNTDISFEAFKGNASTAPYLNGGALRLYQNGGYITIKGVKGVKIQSVELKTTSEYATTVGYCVDDAAAPTTGVSVAKSSTYTISDLDNQSVSIYCLSTDKDYRLEIASLIVKYTKEVIALDHITLSGTYTTEFIQNSTFKHDGVVVTATYSDNDEQVVTSSAVFSTPNMTTTGTKTVTVTYTENEVEKTTSYDITVTAELATALTLGGEYPTRFNEGDVFSHEGLTVTANYNSGRKNIDVTEAVTVSTPNLTTAGVKTVTVSYTCNENTITKDYTIQVVPASAVFYESFDTNDGTGGNDNRWSGSIASNTLKYDNEGWTCVSTGGANKCAKFGAGSTKGSAETPTIAAAGDFMLTFKAAAWDGSSEATTLKLSATGATIKTASVTLVKGAWTEYTVYIVNATNGFKVKFESNTTSNARFFLDEVMIQGVFIRELNGMMGTHCYPFTIKAGAYSGASFYVPAYRIGTSKLYWDEVTGDIEAGKPYLIVPEEGATEFVAVKQAETAPDPVAVGYGMVGVYTQTDISNTGYYIVYNNEFRSAGNYVYVGANRAYINLLSVTDHEVAPAPGRRRILMNNADATVATGMDELNAAVEVSKVLINGQVFILRGAKMYNAQGQLVK